MSISWKTVITPLVCLFCGFALGVTYQKLRGVYPGALASHERIDEPGFLGPKIHPRRLKHLSSQLELTAEQQEKVAQIIEASRAKMLDLRSEVHPRFRKLRAETHRQLREVLTPEQAEKLNGLGHKGKQEGWRKRRMDGAGRWGQRGVGDDAQ